MTQTHYIEIKAIPQVDMLQTEVISFCLQKFYRTLKAESGLRFPLMAMTKPLGALFAYSVRKMIAILFTLNRKNCAITRCSAKLCRFRRKSEAIVFINGFR